MQILSDKRCIIGEDSIWNEKEKQVYYKNAMCVNKLCMYYIYTNKLWVRSVKTEVAVLCVDGFTRIRKMNSRGRIPYLFG